MPTFILVSMFAQFTEGQGTINGSSCFGRTGHLPVLDTDVNLLVQMYTMPTCERKGHAKGNADLFSHSQTI